METKNDDGRKLHYLGDTVFIRAKIAFSSHLNRAGLVSTAQNRMLAVNVRTKCASCERPL